MLHTEKAGKADFRLEIRLRKKPNRLYGAPVCRTTGTIDHVLSMEAIDIDGLGSEFGQLD